MRKVTKKWETGDGQKVRICDMSDEHLRNAIAYCERSHAQSQAVSPPMFGGEMAQLEADRDWERLQESGPEESFPLYESLCEDAQRRGLKI